MDPRDPFIGTALGPRTYRRGLAIVFFALAAALAGLAVRYGELAAWPLPALLVAAGGTGLCAAAAVIAARATRAPWPWLVISVASGAMLVGVWFAIGRHLAGLH